MALEGQYGPLDPHKVGNLLFSWPKIHQFPLQPYGWSTLGFPYDKALRGVGCVSGWSVLAAWNRHLRLLWESTESLELWAPMELCYLGPVSEKVASRWFREDGTLAISGKSMCFFWIMTRKNGCLLETQNRRPKTNETKPSFPFAKENHLPFSIHLRDCGRCHYFFGSHLVLFSAAFLLIHKKWVKFSTPNPGWKQVW